MPGYSVLYCEEFTDQARFKEASKEETGFMGLSGAVKGYPHSYQQNVENYVDIVLLSEKSIQFHHTNYLSAAPTSVIDFTRPAML